MKADDVDDGRLTAIWGNLLSLAFPLRCVHCGAPGYWLCPACHALLEPAWPLACRRCGRPAPAGSASAHRAHKPSGGLPAMGDPNSQARGPLQAPRARALCPECGGRELPFTAARSAFLFEGPARSLVHALKYAGQRRLARFMAGISAPRLGLTAAGKADTLTYVPLHRSKLLTRGYNQAGLYAQAVSRRLDLPLRDLLVKRTLTPAQNRLNFSDRRNNLHESICVRRNASAPPGRVILLDDVYTTGSTAAECARALRDAFGVEVEVRTFARAVRRRAGIPGRTAVGAGEIRRV